MLCKKSFEVTLREDSTILPFALQAIARISDMTIFAREFLYRGAPLPGGWPAVDAALVGHLEKYAVSTLPIFVNLDHNFLLDVPDLTLINASRRNPVYFEINEAYVPHDIYNLLSVKINRLTEQGVKFAIDDFGSGLDGLSRIYALDQLLCVKVDGNLLHAAYQRKHARDSLLDMVSHWNRAGVLTVAEWIESEALLEFALDTGFAMGQGFFLDSVADDMAPQHACSQHLFATTQ